MASKNYRDLIVWQKAMDLVVTVYRLTGQFPDTERYGLTSQMQRCAVSIPSNIANGSRCELETQIMLAARLGYMDDATRHVLLEQAEEVGRMLTGLSKSLQR